MTGLRRARPLLGTLVEIAIDDDLPPAYSEQVLERAFASVARVHALMSYHDPHSELSRLNREAWSRPVTVSSETWRVLSAARELSAASAGLFDITVAPTLARAGLLPRHADQPRASGHGDWRDVELLSSQQVRFARPVRIDLGGIAKGFAVDLAITQLRDNGVVTAQVNAGGDLRVLGGRLRAVHLRHPLWPTQLLPVPTAHAAAATSAGYYQQRVRGGRACSPIVHPDRRTLCDARRSVTVFADDCLTADALTKIVYADPERGSQVLERYQARAVILEPDNQRGDCRVFDSAT